MVSLIEMISAAFFVLVYSLVQQVHVCVLVYTVNQMKELMWNERNVFFFLVFFHVAHTLSCINTIHTITFVDKTKREHEQFSGAMLMYVTPQ